MVPFSQYIRREAREFIRREQSEATRGKERELKKSHYHVDDLDREINNARESAKGPGEMERLSERLQKINEEHGKKLSAEECMKILIDEVSKGDKAVEFIAVDKNGKEGVFKIVPASIDTPERNAVNDGIEGANAYFDDNQQTKKEINKIASSNFTKSIVKGTTRAAGKTIGMVKRNINKSVDQAVGDFGR